MLLCVFVTLFLAFGVDGKITHRHIGPDIRDHVLVELPFGFDANGRIDIIVTNVEPYKLTDDNSDVNLSKFGFFLASARSQSQVGTDYAQARCYLEDDNLFKVMDFSGFVPDGNVNASVVFADHDELVPGEYELFFASCQQDKAVSFDARIAFYSQDQHENRDYLSVGERPLPGIYVFLFLVFSTLAITWAKICYDERRHVHGIHYLMFGLVVLRSVVYFTLAGMYHDDQYTGSPEGWNVAFYVFTFLRGVMFFAVIVLIGTGWSYLRPFIGENEKKILVVVIPLQVFANIAIIILDEMSPARTSFVTLTDLFHLVDIICCCAILFPIVWSIKHLRDGAESDGKAAVNVEKLTLFRHFYILVVVYIYFTRIIVYLLENTLPYDYKWASKLASDLATLAFYVIVGMKFRPHGENLYLKLESDAAL